MTPLPCGVNWTIFSPDFKLFEILNDGTMIVLVQPVTFTPLMTHFTGTPCLTLKTLGSNPLAVTFIVTICSDCSQIDFEFEKNRFLSRFSCSFFELITFDFTPLRARPELNVYMAKIIMRTPATFWKTAKPLFFVQEAVMPTARSTGTVPSANKKQTQSANQKTARSQRKELHALREAAGEKKSEPAQKKRRRFVFRLFQVHPSAH